jgi:hypothetical protein
LPSTINLKEVLSGFSSDVGVKVAFLVHLEGTELGSFIIKQIPFWCFTYRNKKMEST